MGEVKISGLKILMRNDYALIADKMPDEKTIVLEYESLYDI